MTILKMFYSKNLPEMDNVPEGLNIVVYRGSDFPSQFCLCRDINENV